VVDFSRPKQAETTWLQVEKYWEHRSRPSGQRFLGSIRISKQCSEKLLDITAQNLGRVRSLTFDRLCERFDAYDAQRYWIRIITLALSEYAYYSEDDFWQGVCARLNLQNTQGTQNTLREVVRQGSYLLGLRVVRDKRNEGVRCVSTLCLQSGIPQQNLSHFAQLLEEFAQQYDWWDIAHAEPEDLSQLLYEFCQQKHPQWRKLRTFLKSSCTDSDEEAEPVSGELLQGLAVVAQALERQGLEPAVLQDAHQREQLLQNFCLPNTFFLRSWDNLIQVLTPQEKNSNDRRKLVSWRKKPLLLMLDVVDSRDIQLVLPAQMLWQPVWRNCRGTYAQIKEPDWETTLPIDGALEIPELTLRICNMVQSWVWHLRSHTDESLTEWHCQGVTQDFPVLIFDAWTGDRVIPSNELKGTTEIICFYDRSIQLRLSDGIELIDSFVPCSISGWRGQQLQLISEKAQLTIDSAQPTQVIDWDNSQTNYPQLRGIKLKCKETTYLEVPSIWHPPISLPNTINIQVEDIKNRKVLTELNEQISLSPSGWQQITLSRWINQSGTYVVKLWSGNERWSEKFELKSNFSLEQSRPISSIQVYDRTRHPIEIPQQISSSGQFWLKELELKNLWPLEEVEFNLSNGWESEDYEFVRQADASGILFLSLAALRDVLPDSDWYSLSYQRSGENRYRLIEIATEEIKHIWSQQEVHISGLRPNISYDLSLWNLLKPEEKEILVNIDKSSSSFQCDELENIITVSLANIDTLGIFLVQLKLSANSSSQVIGWWSNIWDNRNTIFPDELDNNYCFNILGNEDLDDFHDLADKIHFDDEHIRKGISSLQSNEGYLPDWLDQDLLLKKIQSILPSNISSVTTSPESSISKPQNLIYSLDIKKNTPTIRKAFCKRFSDQLKKSGFGRSIQLIKDPVLRDLLRVQIEDQQYLPRLKAILTDLESALHTSIRLEKWR
jgi:hypothetical protein